MEIKTYVLMAVSVITAAVVFGACLPVFADTTQADDTFTNEGYYRMSEYGTDTDIILSWTYEKPNVVTVNNVDFPISAEDNVNKTVLFCPTSGVRVSYGGTFCQVLGAAGTASADLADSETITVNCTNGTLTVEMNGSNVAALSTTYTNVYCISNDGPYIMKDTNTPAYINGDSEIYAYGVTSINNNSTVLYLNGNIDDGVTVTQVTTNNQATYSTPVIDKTTETSHNDLYKINKITFNAEIGGSTTAITYSYFVVPYEITAERSIHPTGATLTLMELLPVLIGAGLLVGVVGAVIVRRL